MKKILTLFLFLYSFNTAKAQCFECAFNIGGWINDQLSAFDVNASGFIVHYDSHSWASNSIEKYSHECKLQWRKLIGNYSVINIVFHNDYIYSVQSNHYNKQSELVKMDEFGNILWSKKIGGSLFTQASKLAIIENSIYITGNTKSDLDLDSKIKLPYNETTNLMSFIAQFDTDGNALKAINFNNKAEYALSAEIDPEGNIYLATINGRTNQSNLFQFNKALEIKNTWSMAENSQHYISNLYFNPNNKKLYTWGRFFNKVVIQNREIKSDKPNNFAQILLEINPENGKIENFLQSQNNSGYEISLQGALTNPGFEDIGYMAAHGDNLYIYSNFSGDFKLKHEVIKGTYQPTLDYGNVETILFKINTNDFTTKSVLVTSGVRDGPFNYRNASNFIKFNGDDLYITSTITSEKFIINNQTINNNSGNHNSDIAIYKYNIHNLPSSVSIAVNNTCFGQMSNFSILGDFDAVKWNFGDGTSSLLTSPNHTYSHPGAYTVTAEVTCNNETRILTLPITIGDKPILNHIEPVKVCENEPNSSIATFDTTQIIKAILGNQTNVDIKFYDQSNKLISNFTNNIFSHTIKGNEVITAKANFKDNPSCQTSLTFTVEVSKKTNNVLTDSIYDFCIQDFKQLKDLPILGENLKFYSVSGTLLEENTLLTNGAFFVTQTNLNKCESNFTKFNVKIQNTVIPTASAIQSFCSYNHSQLKDVIIDGESIQWYSTPNSTTPLPSSTLLVHDKIYYASQTINGCESLQRSAVHVNLEDYKLLTTSPLITCRNENEMGIFDLDNKKMEIAKLLRSTVSNIAFFNTLSDAQHNKNPLVSPWKNDNGSKEIFATTSTNTPCKELVKIPLTENLLPFINLQSIYNKCSTESIRISLDNSFESILWSNGEKTKGITIKDPGQYSVMVSNNSCSILHHFEIKNYDPLPMEYIYDGSSVRFFFKNMENIQYSTDGKTWSSNATFIRQPGEYIFHFKSPDGCIEVHTLYLYKDLPNFISPNGDGKNDLWDVSFVKNLEDVSIFDRKGRLIFYQTKDQQPIKWDGKYNNQPLHSDTYWYKIRLSVGKDIDGSILLKNKE